MLAAFPTSGSQIISILKVVCSYNNLIWLDCIPVTSFIALLNQYPEEYIFVGILLYSVKKVSSAWIFSRELDLCPNPFGYSRVTPLLRKICWFLFCEMLKKGHFDCLGGAVVSVPGCGAEGRGFDFHVGKTFVLWADLFPLCLDGYYLYMNIFKRI